MTISYYKAYIKFYLGERMYMSTTRVAPTREGCKALANAFVSLLQEDERRTITITIRKRYRKA